MGIRPQISACWRILRAPLDVATSPRSNPFLSCSFNPIYIGLKEHEERGGFEPPVSCPTMVFETIPFNRSGTSPIDYSKMANYEAD